MNYITRREAIEQAGLDAVEAVEAVNCEPTNRVTGDGTMEFRASVLIDAENGTHLAVYYYQDEETAMKAEDLSDLDWEIEGYEIV